MNSELMLAKKQKKSVETTGESTPQKPLVLYMVI